nr:unnamed protein product [Callosobruchus chinensis]
MRLKNINATTDKEQLDKEQEHGVRLRQGSVKAQNRWLKKDDVGVIIITCDIVGMAIVKMDDSSGARKKAKIYKEGGVVVVVETDTPCTGVSRRLFTKFKGPCRITKMNDRGPGYYERKL